MMDNWDSNSGKRLRCLRIKKDFKKADFCKTYNISLEKLEKIELGIECPNTEIIKYINCEPQKKKKSVKKELMFKYPTKEIIEYVSGESQRKKELAFTINIPDNVVNYLKEAIYLKKFEQICELETDKEEALIPVKKDMEILLEQKKEILGIPYEQLTNMMKYCFKHSNLFCLNAILNIYNKDIKNISEIERAYSGVILTATVLLKGEKNKSA